MGMKNRDNPWHNLVRTLKKDPKRAAILTFLAVVLAVLWLRRSMGSGEAPSRAIAITAQADDSASSRARPDKRGSEGAAALRQWLAQPLAPIGRNLFAVNFDYFAPENAAASDSLGRFWGTLAKSVSEQADLKRERQILVENLRQQASQLRLQSTMMGATPKAVVNGELLGEGDVVASFRVLKIEARRIVVEREGIQLAIPMK